MGVLLMSKLRLRFGFVPHGRLGLARNDLVQASECLSVSQGGHRKEDPGWGIRVGPPQAANGNGQR